MYLNNTLKRWENLPNNENRNYKVRCYRVSLELSEENSNYKEVIIKKFISSENMLRGLFKKK